MKNIIVVFIIAFLMPDTFAQSGEIKIPLNLREAYRQNTRSMDGAPGANYWQNSADYNINLQFDPLRKRLVGNETITYYNNSPDYLDRLVIKLYHDIYQKGNLRDFSVSPEDVTEGVQITHLAINQHTLTDTHMERSGTNLIIHLTESLAPGNQLILAVSWESQIPADQPIRAGAYEGKNAFFLAYWFPRIAVYDDVDGWDTFSYTGMQEYYNDFGNYDVKISAPEDYVIWATGLLQNPEQVFSQDILKKYLLATKSDQIINVVDHTTDWNRVTVSKEEITWHFKAENVTDFAFASSNQYYWDATSLWLDGRRVLINAAYDPSSRDFYKVAEISRKSISFFSNEMPGVPYPFPSMTVFNGAGGMEFPMMVNDGTTSKWSSTVHLTSHEIAHTYFPFFMGINEKKYPFMDEGWATMLPFELQNQFAPEYDPITRAANYYLDGAGHELESPVILPAIALGGNVYRPSYRHAAYYKPGMAYHFLQEVLGEELFKEALHHFMNNWAGKHPIPYDFFFSFNKVAGEDLNWFWQPWFFQTGYPDPELSQVDLEANNQVRILVKQNGNIPVPLMLTIRFEDDSQQIIRKSARIWQDGATQKEILLNFDQPVVSIQLGDSKIPDANKDNNRWINEHKDEDL